jgi:hypothetical protein
MRLCILQCAEASTVPLPTEQGKTEGAALFIRQLGTTSNQQQSTLVASLSSPIRGDREGLVLLILRETIY